MLEFLVFPGGNIDGEGRSLLGFFLFLLGQRVVRFAALDIAAFLNQVAHLVGRYGQLALRADIQCGREQEVVTPPHSLR
jgi:hypothetical protein